MILGYTQASERPPTISLYVMLKPRLMPPPSLPEQISSGELDDITRYAHRCGAHVLMGERYTCTDGGARQHHTLCHRCGTEVY